MSEILSVLMIDDNPADGDTVRRYLKDDTVSQSVEFEQVLSAEEALGALSDRRYDVLFVDYHFPFGNGFDLLRKIREEGIGSPAVMLTGQGDEEVAGQAVTENLSAYLPKAGLSPEALDDTLRTVLAGENRVASPDATGQLQFDSTGRDWILPGPEQLLSNLSAVSSSSGGGLVLFEFQFDHAALIPSESLTRLAGRLSSVLTDSDLRFHRVDENVLGAILEEEPFEVLRDEEIDNMRSVVREAFSGALLQPENDLGTLTVRKLLLAAESFDRDPALTVNRGLDTLADPTSTAPLIWDLSLREEVNHG